MVVVKLAGLEGIGGRLRIKLGEMAIFSLGGEVSVNSGLGVSGWEIDIKLKKNRGFQGEKNML